MPPRLRLELFGLFSIAAALAAGCQTGGRGAPAEVPTLQVQNHEFGVHRYVGQTVRVCGRLVQIRGDWAVQHIRRPGDFFFHGEPAVLVVACGGEPPRLDTDGCLTGRIAARDGALTLPMPRRVEWDDAPIHREWFLHPQCRAGGPRNF